MRHWRAHSDANLSKRLPSLVSTLTRLSTTSSERSGDITAICKVIPQAAATQMEEVVVPNPWTWTKARKSPDAVPSVSSYKVVGETLTMGERLGLPTSPLTGRVTLVSTCDLRPSRVNDPMMTGD